LGDVVAQIVVQCKLKEVTVKIVLREVNPEDVLVDPRLRPSPDVRAEGSTGRPGPSEEQIAGLSLETI
jgi:hypothetical protein